MTQIALINFNKDFKYGEVQKPFDLSVALITAGVSEGQIFSYQMWVNHVVHSVKQQIIDSADRRCNVDFTNSILQLMMPTNQLVMVAMDLYHSYGIEIQQTALPSTIVVTWQQDHPYFNPSSHYIFKFKMKGELTDCTLKFGSEQYTAHKIVLASKSSVFSRMFLSSMKESQHNAIIECSDPNIEPSTFKRLITFFYKGELGELSFMPDVRISEIDQLIQLADYYDLPHLNQLCFENLLSWFDSPDVHCQHFEKARALIRKSVDHEELEVSLIERLSTGMTLDTIEPFIELAIKENNEFLLNVCEEYIVQDVASDVIPKNDVTKALALASKYEFNEVKSACEKKLASMINEDETGKDD